MKLGVALAQPVQSGFDPHHGLDAEADLFPFVRALSLSTSLSAFMETAELESEGRLAEAQGISHFVEF